MLAGQAEFALSYHELQNTPHLRLVPAELSLFDHSWDFHVSLPMSVPYQLAVDGKWVDQPLMLGVACHSSQRDGEQTILVEPE